jgi:hypothetical protein
MNENANFIRNIEMSVPRRTSQAVDEQTHALTSLMSGRATFEALARAVHELRRTAPADCDVFILVGNIAVREARFIEPHTITFEGFIDGGKRAWVVQHFSQLNATVIYSPKHDETSFTTKILWGFNPNAPAA